MIEKADARDFGGEEILNNIKNDILEIVDDAITLNMICYCNHILKEFNSESLMSGYTCPLCYESLRHKFFACIDQSCFYKRITETPYFVCPSCYEKGTKISLGRTDDEMNHLTVSKLRYSIHAAS